MSTVTQFIMQSFLDELLLTFTDEEDDHLFGIGYRWVDVDPRSRRNVLDMATKLYHNLGSKCFLDEFMWTKKFPVFNHLSLVRGLACELGRCLFHEACYRYGLMNFPEKRPWLPDEEQILNTLAYGSAFWFLDARFEPFCERLFRAVPFRLNGFYTTRAPEAYEIISGVVFPNWRTKGWRS